MGNSDELGCVLGPGEIKIKKQTNPYFLNSSSSKSSGKAKHLEVWFPFFLSGIYTKDQRRLGGVGGGEEEEEKSAGDTGEFPRGDL